VAHGISAAAGKFGALLAGIIFHKLSTPAIFLLSAACGLIGALVTWLFVPDVTTLDMKELDKRWASLRAGGPAYSGPAVDPKYLSVWERLAGAAAGPATSPKYQHIELVELPAYADLKQ
jgi:hypothetical protein